MTPPPSEQWRTTWREVIVSVLAPPEPRPGDDPRTKIDHAYLRGRWHEVVVPR